MKKSDAEKSAIKEELFEAHRRGMLARDSLWYLVCELDRPPLWKRVLRAFFAPS